MLHHPVKNKEQFEHVVVSGIDHPKTPYTLDFTARLCRLIKAKKLTLVEELPVDQLVVSAGHDQLNTNYAPDAQHSLMHLFEDKNDLERLLQQLASDNMQLEIDKREGKPGHCVSVFAKEAKADLLVLNSPDTELGLLDRLFPHDLEYALSNLPCSLFVVHPQGFEFN